MKRFANIAIVLFVLAFGGFLVYGDNTEATWTGSIPGLGTLRFSTLQVTSGTVTNLTASQGVTASKGVNTTTLTVTTLAGVAGIRGDLNVHKGILTDTLSSSKTISGGTMVTAGKGVSATTMTATGGIQGGQITSLANGYFKSAVTMGSGATTTTMAVGTALTAGSVAIGGGSVYTKISDGTARIGAGATSCTVTATGLGANDRVFVTCQTDGVTSFVVQKDLGGGNFDIIVSTAPSANKDFDWLWLKK